MPSIIVRTTFIRLSTLVTCTAALYSRTEFWLIHIITNTPCLTAPSLNPSCSWVWNIYHRIRCLSKRSNHTEPIDLILLGAGNYLLYEVMGNIYIDRMSNIRTSSHYMRTRYVQQLWPHAWATTSSIKPENALLYRSLTSHATSCSFFGSYLKFEFQCTTLP
jgi:hypothetical protein